jgi:hypothetical protein
MTLKRSERSGKMLNINTDGRKTIFMDVDGTLVEHNYDPENDPEVLLEKTIQYLHRHSDCCIVLVTARREEHLRPLVRMLDLLGIKIFGYMCGIPTGQRILINDYRGDHMIEPTAVALNVPSGEGVNDTANCEFHKQWCS